MKELEKKLLALKIQLNGILDNKRYIVFSMWFFCCLGWVAISMMPNKYETTTRVYADTTSILRPLLQGLAVHEDVKQEIQTTSRTLLNREALEDIAKNSDLHLEAETPEKYEKLLLDLKDEILINGSAKSNVYDISYTHKDPNMAMKIVELTLKKFVDASAGRTRADSASATQFLDEKIEEYKLRLEISEKELAQFQRKNQQYLPGKGNSYYESVSLLNIEKEDVQQMIKERTSEIDGLKGRFIPDSNNSETISSGVKTSFDERVAKLENIRAELKIRYTKKHPTIIELNRSIEDIKSLQKKEQQAILSQASKGAMTSTREGENLVLQQFSLKISELEAQRDVLKTRLVSIDNKLLDFKERLDFIPTVEAKIIDLKRNYANDQRYYQELLKRRDSAEISRSADAKSQDVKFKILDEPRVSSIPVGPPRIILYSLALIFGAGFGLCLSFAKSKINNIIVGQNHLELIVGEFNVIGSIENLNGRSVKRKKALMMTLSIFMIATLLLIFVALIGHEMYYDKSPMMWIL